MANSTPSIVRGLAREADSLWITAADHAFDGPPAVSIFRGVAVDACVSPRTNWLGAAALIRVSLIGIWPPPLGLLQRHSLGSVLDRHLPKLKSTGWNSFFRMAS